MALPLEPIAAVTIIICVLLAIVVIVFVIIGLTKRREWTEFEDYDPLRATQMHQGFRNKFPSLEILMYVLRWIFLLFSAGIELYVYTLSKTSLSFYTVWNFSLLCIYFTGAIVCQTWKYVKLPQNKIFYYISLFTSVIFEIEFPTAFLVDFLLWLVLYPSSGNPASLLQFTSIIQHAVNVFMLIIDFIFNDLPIRPFSVLFQLLFPILYCYFSFIYHSQTGIWVYFFLDLNVPYAVGWYAAVTVIHIAFFYALYGLYRLKMYFSCRISAIVDDSVPISSKSEMTITV